MRKLIIEEWISLDGYVSDREGKLDFFASTVRKIGSEPEQIKYLQTIDCILFGRTTYEQFAKLWPQRPVENEVLAEVINKEKKLIFSKTLHHTPWGIWPDAEVSNGGPVSTIKNLKSSPGKNIVVWGSISLAQFVMKENLVDELRLHVCPAIVGGGRKLFSDNLNPANLKLGEVRHRESGVVSMVYHL